MSLSIIAGILFTFFILNKDVFYAKENYNAYILQYGAYNKLENAQVELEKLPFGIIIQDSDYLYKIYVGVAKDLNIVNKMLLYFKNKNINIYLKNIKITKDISENIDNYEKLFNENIDEKVYININQSILNMYEERMENEKKLFIFNFIFISNFKRTIIQNNKIRKS